jgi:signal peptidase I
MSPSTREEGAAAAGAAGERGALRALWDQTKTIAFAIAIALLIRFFVIEPFRIPSGSMLPTLLIGDHLFVNKFVYGVQIPGTGIRLPGLRDPQRGDVVVFTVAKQGGSIFPADRRPDLPMDRFVKRIIGLPGDTIEVRDGLVILNGQPVQRDPTGETFTDEKGRDLVVWRERHDSVEIPVLDDPAGPGLERSAFRIEEGRYFMMGDNRDDSNDSRAWGTVRLEDMKGPAFVLYWSWDVGEGWGYLLNPLNWWELLTERTHWSRIGDVIH